MITNDNQAALKLQSDSKALHEAFLVWFADKRKRFESEYPGMDTWMLELTAWHEFKKSKGI